MSAKRKPNPVKQAMSAEHLRAVQERRRSNASGTHGWRRVRAAEKARALKDQE